MRYFFSILIIFIFLVFGFYRLSNNSISNNLLKAMDTTKVSSTKIVSQSDAPKTSITRSAVAISPSNALPHINDWKNLSDDDLHNGPTLLSLKSEWLGKIVEAADRDAAQKPESLQELRTCAQNKELVPAVRASCIISYLDLEPNAELLKEFGREDSQVLELAQFLLD